MAIKSSDQISLVDLTDGFSVILTNDSYTFPGTTNAAKAGSTTTTIVAMCGADQIPAAVDNSKIIAPTGVTTSVDTDATQPTVTISVTTAVKTGGTVDIPVSLDGGNIMVAYTKLSPNHSGQRTHTIDRITPHCVVGQCTAEGLGDWFAKSSTQASSNYGIDRDGRVGLYVEEKNRSWCSSSNANDQRAITIECASDTSEPYAFRDVVYQTLIKLCVDICKRNGKKKLIWFGDKDKTLNYSPKSDEMILTVHRWFANKSCPGNWMYARIQL